MFRMSKNKAITLVFMVLSLGALLYVVQKNNMLKIVPIAVEQIQTALTKTDATSQVSEYFIEQIKKQEEQAWDLLQTDTRVTKEECFQKQQKDYPTYKSSLKGNWNYKRSRYPKLKQETVNFVQDVLRDFNIDPTNIQIVPYKGEGSPAAADDGTIFIDEKEFAHFSPDACKFFIAHEISHLQAQDDSVYQSLYALANRKKAPHQKKKKALETFRRFQETRADVYALLRGGEKYAPGAFDFFYKLQELDGGDNPGITHPKTSKRIEMAQHICQEMGWNVAMAQA